MIFPVLRAAQAVGAAYALRSARTLAAATVLSLVVTLVVAMPAVAQGPAAANPEMRHFWHVFIAYAIAWVLVFVWVVSIVKRLKKVEEKLGD